VLFHPGREFERDHDFADADRMEPGQATEAEPGAGFGVVEAEALPELLAVIPAPEHFCDIARKEEKENEGEKQIVEQADHGAARLLLGSAAILRAGDGV
jgi:hypothetical protein